MPIYEFECEECGANFDDLVSVGTEHAACPECGSERTTRRYSSFASAFKLVKTPGAARQQEVRNAKRHKDAKAQFKERRRQAREAKGKGGQSGG